MWRLVVVYLVILHTLDGREIDVNPDQITSMREARDDKAGDKSFTGGVRCMINTSDGKFVSVVEPCATVRHLIEESRR